MAGRIFEVAFRISGELNGNFGAAISAAQRQIQGLSRQISAQTQQSMSQMARAGQNLSRLYATRNVIDQYRGLNQAINQNSAALVRARLQAAQFRAEHQREIQQTERMQQAYDRLNAVYRANRNSMSVDDRVAMQAQIRAAREELQEQRQRTREAGSSETGSTRESDNLARRLQQQREQLAQLQSNLRSAGVDLSQMAAHETELENAIQRTTRELERQHTIEAARTRHTDAQTNLSYAADNFQNSLSTVQTIMSPFTNAVKVSMDFNAAMSEVKAISGATGEDFESLRNQAKELGSTTKFTASEAAAGMKYLAVAGWDTNQILKGMPDMLALAQAGNVDLARTADIVSDGLTAFNMDLNKTPDAANRFANAMVAAATGSNTSVELMGETFKYAGAVAGSLGYSIEDVALATGLMGNASIKGSMAGTALRSTFTRLVKPPKEAAAALEALGVSAVNSDGTMKPFRQTLGDLRTAFKGLSESQKTEYAASIAGQEAMAGFLAMVTAGEGDFAKLQKRIDSAQNQNLLGNIQDVMGDNLQDSFESLNSATEGLQIAIGDAFQEPLQNFISSIASGVGELAQWVDQHQNLAQAAGIAAAAISAVIVAAAGYSMAAAGVEYLSASYAALRLQAIGSATAQRAAQLAAMSWSQIGAGISGAFTGLIGKIQAARMAVVSFFTTAAATNGASIVTSITNIGTAFLNAAKGAMAFAFSPVGVALMALALAGYYVYTHWSQVAPVFESLAATLGGALSGAVETISAAFQNLGVAVSNLSPAFSNLGGVIFGALAVVLNAVVNIAATIISTFANAIATVISFFGNLGNAISAFLAGDFSKAGEFLKQALVSAFEGAINTIKSLFGGVFDTFSNFFKPIEIMAQTPQPAASGGGSFAAPAAVAPQVDTSQAQAGVESLGNASTNAATAVESNSQAVQAVSQNMAQVGETFAQIPQAVQPFADSMAQLAPAVQPAADGLNLVGTSTQTVNAELLTAQGSLSANNAQLSTSTGALSTFNGNLASTNGGLQSLASNSSNTAGSVSNLGTAASNAVLAMQNAAANAASSISAAASAAAAKPAANAQGGIYNRGAFLTWFAEKSPEAAIPLDKSARAISLWQKAGQMLGILPKEISEGYDKPSTNETVSARQPKFDELGNIIGLHGLNDNIISKDDDIQVTNSKKTAQLAEWRKKYPAQKSVTPKPAKQTKKGGIFSGLENIFDFLPKLPTLDGFKFNPLETSHILPENPVKQNQISSLDNLPENVKQSKTFQTLQAARERLQNTKTSDSIFGNAPKTENIFSGGLQLPNFDGTSGGIIPNLIEKISSGTDGGNFSSPIDLQFSINIQGNANAEDVQNGIVQSIPMLRDVFENQLAEYNHEKQRRSFS